MSGKERRERMLQILRHSKVPVPGKDLAKTLGVSRQVVVQDIALLRAQNLEITATNTGYILKQAKEEPDKKTRVFKVSHSGEETREELEIIVNYGGVVEDVFINHRVYGILTGNLHIVNHEDIEKFMEELESGKSTLLMNVTSGYHYHTVSAPTETLLDLIQEKLRERGFLARLQDYEPIDFWKESPGDERS